LIFPIEMPLMPRRTVTTALGRVQLDLDVHRSFVEPALEGLRAVAAVAEDVGEGEEDVGLAGAAVATGVAVLAAQDDEAGLGEIEVCRPLKDLKLLRVRRRRAMEPMP
jgi:hypothetical protein